MKTPWRFLSGLVSRKAADDHAAEQVTKAPDILAVEHHPVQDEKSVEEKVAAQPSSQLGTYPSKADTKTIEAVSAAVAASEADVVEEEAAPIDMPSSVATEFVTSNVPSVTSSSVRQAHENERAGPAAAAPNAKNSGEQALSKSEVTLAEKTGPAKAPVEKTAHQEMLMLDQEIAELRRLLSEKLSLQNAYLKSMLDRYTSNG